MADCPLVSSPERLLGEALGGMDGMLKSEPSDRRMSISHASMHVLLAINTQTWLGKAWRGCCSTVAGAFLQ